MEDSFGKFLTLDSDQVHNVLLVGLLAALSQEIERLQLVYFGFVAYADAGGHVMT